MSRTRNYATIVYPESAPNNWVGILENECVPCFISPLHDKDMEATGEPKKAHYHVMVMFSNVKTEKQAQQIFDKINGVGIVTINDIRAYSRYLCHLDSYEKYKYQIEDVISLGGANYFDVISLASDKYTTIREMILWCKENNVIIYSDLLEYASIHKHDWFRVLCDNGTMVMKEYLKSVGYKNRKY